MSRTWKTVLGVLGLILAILLGWAVFMFRTFEDPPVDPAWAVEGTDDIPDGAVSVRYTGTATLVFSDGETTWMTDGWFSRPSLVAVLSAPIEPDVDAIETGLARNEVDDLVAVFPLHSHYDHAMDAPEVAKRTGALLLGSE
ncbi:MAG: MBL fold metallo-hydrolase, partial [Myxococcota bacterium]